MTVDEILTVLREALTTGATTALRCPAPNCQGDGRLYLRGFSGDSGSTLPQITFTLVCTAGHDSSITAIIDYQHRHKD